MPKNKKLRINKKLIFYFILLAILVFGTICSTVLAFSKTKNEVVKYHENSNIDYKVYLKKNDFYNKDYLDKGMVYVASLIDKIKVNYNYNFNVNKKSDIDISYKVIAKLVISSQNNTNIFFEKEDDLTDTITKTIEKDTDLNFSENVEIDYDYYNNLANKFKSNYAVNTNSYLEVYLKVDENSKESNSYLLNNESKTTLTIPLSEQEVNITLNNDNVNEEKEIISKKSINSSINYIVICLVLFILTIFTIIKLIKYLEKFENAYDRYINKILRGYDRLIVNVKTAPKLRDYNIIQVENFEELIDVRDNVKEPIRYLEISKHKKCKFYIINNKDLYLFTVNSIDLDGESDEEDTKED